MSDSKETETNAATPEQLLKILDTQLASQRSHRGVSSRNRAIILVVGLIFIVGAAGAALLVLDQMLADLRQNGPAPETVSGATPGNF